ncbi:ATP-grasp domain-containing protein [Stutzerimonas stutzeri]|uniref:ATP-grasp domain-containing protein n=1 Tax=Stutzerimonas stutzeri TaxID=316 RepID=UPI002109AE86|nr:ATP-grasp domain-containing protein [Stutzerimonas stutzeri]MCQ4319021.1 ATP-grasp domain-containing protein [Stutzerimonas stutzeri]
MLLFLEGQSSQRDVIAGAREALPSSVLIYASHGHDRPEITGLANVAWLEPEDEAERIEWALASALENGIKVVLAGRSGQIYEGHRERFQAQGIQLVTGCTSLAGFQLIDDKGKFTIEATNAGLACVPAIAITTAEELLMAYREFEQHGQVCVKPAVGIYGLGFWRLNETVDPFRCLANTDAREANLQVFADLYSRAEDPKPLLVMPYMPGTECSVDMVCENGKVVAHVGRRKQGLAQTFEREGAAVELAINAAEHFKCDGLINAQTRDDASGVPHLLEINPRYSGGIGYTRQTGINLPGIFATRRLGLPVPASAWANGVRVKAITVAVRLSPANGNG